MPTKKRLVMGLFHFGLFIALALMLSTPVAGDSPNSHSPVFTPSRLPHGLSATDWAILQRQPQVSNALLGFSEKKLVVNDGPMESEFGYAVATSGDTVVVGGLYDSANLPTPQGFAYVFARNQGGPENWGLVKELTAGDGATYNGFGYAVAMSGEIIVVGATISNAVYVFARNQGGPDNWGQVKRLTASDGAANDRFGSTVAISGDTLIVGATGDDVGSNSDQGSAYVFARNQGGPDNWGEVKKLTASDGLTNDYFGIVAIDKDTLAVGAVGPISPSTTRDAVYIFARDQGGLNNWGEVKKVPFDSTTLTYFGRSVAINGETLVVGTASNAAYVFGRNQGGADNWGLVKPLTGQAGDSFGYSVDINTDTLVVGAFMNSGQGAAYLFERNRGGADNWGETPKLTASDGTGGAFYGIAVSISGGTIVIGASGDNNFQGSAYVYLPGPELSLTKLVDNPTPPPGQTIHYSLVFSNIGLGASTNTTLSDTLPAGLTLAGPVTLNPPGLGLPGTLPNLVTGLTLAAGQSLTVTVPVMVNTGQAANLIITNTATLTSSEVLTPLIASATITLADAPLVARDDFMLTALDTSLTLLALGNDGDPNGDPLTLSEVGTPISGVVSIEGTVLVYTPTVGFLGTDTFTYTVNTSTENTNATVRVLVAVEVFKLHLPMIQR